MRGRVDALLVLMALIWGANFSAIKLVLREMSPWVFNGFRLVLASAVFLFLIALGRGGRPAPRDLLRLSGLGFIGHFIYQICFLEGLSRTSVANSALIMGCSPVFVILLAATLGQERVTRWQWLGSACSVLGVYVILRGGPSWSSTTLTGDLLTLGAVFCWAIYTVGSRPLLTRMSPLEVTGYSMVFGTAVYLPFALPPLFDLEVRRVGSDTWVLVVLSALLALCVSYWIWYTAVREIGAARAATYSNMVPVVAIAIAVLWLGERVDASKLAGTLMIVSGVTASRMDHRQAATQPPEE